MNKVNKLKSLYCLLIALTLCAVAIFALNFSKVKADDEGETSATTENVANASDFWLESGADVYINDDNANDYMGIRFTAKISESYLNSVSANAKTVRYWIIIAPAKNVNNDAANLSLENYANVNAKIVSATGDLQSDNSGNKLYRGSVKYNFANSEWTEEKQQAMIDLPLVARPCLAITDSEGNESVIYANLNNAPAKVMRNVADAALADIAQKCDNESDKYYLASQDQLDILLSYVKQEDVNAYHATDVDQNSNLAFIDNATLKNYNVYKTQVASEGAYFVKIGSIDSKDCEKAQLTETTLFNDVEVGTDVAIYLSNGTDFIKTTAKQITKVIYDYEDLKVFDFSDVTSADKARIIDGYYVLGDNIIDTSFIHNIKPLSILLYNLKKDYEVNGTSVSKFVWSEECGFHGTFDGLGHYVTIKTCAGLFNYVRNGSVIKNVELKDITLQHAVSTNYTTVFGHLETGTMSNVKVSFSADTYKNLEGSDDLPISDTLLTSREWNRYSILGYQSQMDYENVIVEYDYAKAAEGTPATYKYVTLFEMPRNKHTLNNVYLLELNKKADTNYVLPLKYVNAQYNSVSYNADEVSAFVKTYSSYEEMKNYFTGEGSENLKTFSNDYWNKEQGFPVWANSYSELNFATDLGTILFSGWADETDTDGDNQVLPQDLKIDGTVSGVYLFIDGMKPVDLTENLYDSASKKVNLSNASTKVLYKDVIIATTSDNYYKATLAVYTRILTSADDLKMFDFSDVTTADAKRFVEGCFALGNDIDASDILINQNALNIYTWNIEGAGKNYQNYGGFKGLFDGMGHSIKIKTGAGLFNYVHDGSVIKNVELKDTIIVYTSGMGNWISPFGEMKDGTMSDVKVSFSEETYNNLNSTSGVIVSVLGYLSKMDYENVIVEYDYDKVSKEETATTSCFSLLQMIMTKTSIKNVYVIELNKNDSATYALNFSNMNTAYHSGNPYTQEEVGTLVGNYASYDEIKGYFEENTDKLSAFDSGCWDTSSGYPVWKNSIEQSESAE